ncbi:uncharacterized protein EMH_0013830 [Eimeria mitis]|uniref:Uncharacterized protein n=1 Tax=Eimeria mitis TaxID=44415 RepID=U6K538_9EIME|nr:uncharacterized protein EMH_0013830 [Eimeria mitis]CDJ32824.1 hypothetical protein, conserved [Eimeria mitis]
MQRNGHQERPHKKRRLQLCLAVGLRKLGLLEGRHVIWSCYRGEVAELRVVKEYSSSSNNSSSNNNNTSSNTNHHCNFFLRVLHFRAKGSRPPPDDGLARQTREGLKQRAELGDAQVQTAASASSISSTSYRSSTSSSSSSTSSSSSSYTDEEGEEELDDEFSESSSSAISAAFDGPLSADRKGTAAAAAAAPPPPPPPPAGAAAAAAAAAARKTAKPNQVDPPQTIKTSSSGPGRNISALAAFLKGSRLPTSSLNKQQQQQQQQQQGVSSAGDPTLQEGGEPDQLQHPQQQQQQQQQQRGPWQVLRKTKVGGWLLGRDDRAETDLFEQIFVSRWIAFPSETAALQAFDVLAQLLDNPPGQGLAEATLSPLA